MSERLVVVGGDAAGMAAAAQARRRRDVDTLEILAFERGRFTSYSACGIPYWVAGVVPDRDMLIARAPAEHRARGVDVRMRHEVIGIDPAAGTVQVVDLDAGSEAAVGFDHLMLATGAVPVRPDLPGIDAEGIHGIQTLGDAERLRDDLARHRPDRAVIVGGGYIGLEVAGALLARGLDVTVVHVHAHPIASLDADMGTLVAGALRDAGADLRACHRVEGFDVDPGGRVTAVHTDTGEPIPAGLVVLGLGVQPDVELARRAGIEIGPAGGVAVDRRCRTSNDAVWSGGDCSEKFHRVRQEPVAIALGTHANKQGRVAGINLGGGYATFPGVVGTAATKVCGAEVARTGLTEEEAEAAGFRTVSETVTSTTRAGYYPEASSLTVKVVAEHRSGRLLGAQIVGEEGAAKRIDVFATALWNTMTVDELINVDLSYAPPVAPLWDPVLIAARKAWQAVEAAM